MMDLEWERKVYQIVLEAQEKQGAELQAFLDEACDDLPMRREVELRLEGIQKVLRRAKKWFDGGPLE